jgi:16S rRNA pseudouridine516 synthase
MRLDKFICKSTKYTLIDALALIENRAIVVDGGLAVSGNHQVHKNNVVMLNGERLIPRSFRYFLINKPIGMICSNVDEKYPSVLNLLDVDSVTELHIAGRLDVDTTGLVLVTDDGHWSYNLTSPKNNCEKVYEVSLFRPISADATQLFLAGVVLQGETAPTLPAKLDIFDSYNVSLTLTEGRFHQVKRMFSALGSRVKSLRRQQIGSLELDVDIGQWRSLTHAEVDGLSIKD